MTTFNERQLEALKAPLSRNHVKERSQSGRSFSYIEGWHAIAEANRIFGFDNWDRETLEYRLVGENACKVGAAKRDGWNVTYIVRVRIRVGDIIRDGTGSGHGTDANLGLAHESAIKEAETDAMKRAFMTFGNPFGLALYDKEQKEVIDGVVEEQDNSETLSLLIDRISKFENVDDLKNWWDESRNIREEYGIIKGTKDYDFLWAAFLMRGKKLKGEQNG
jgi:DNA recombination protein Rad52